MPKSANAVLARVRAMYGKRLTKEDYDHLLSCNSNAEIANYLKTRTDYGDIFAPNTATQVTAESIEFSLKKEVSAKLQKICNFERLIHDTFFDYFILRSDIALITGAARTLVSTSTLASSYIPSDFFSERSTLKINSLYNAGSAGELIAALEHTRYYPAAKKFIGADGMFDFSMVEVHLMRFYAECAKKISHRFDKKSEKELNELIDLEIDSFNISNIFRHKKLGTKEEMILPRIISEHGTLGKEKLLKLLNAQTDAQFIELLNQTAIGKGFTSANLIYPEAVFQTNLLKIHKRYLRFSSNPDVVLVCYFYLLEQEVGNITHILEGKRYALANDEIKKFLIGVA